MSGVSVIRTVRGDIAPADLGRCYAHEHIVIESSFVTAQSPEFLLEDVERITTELKAFRAAGGRAVVDSMPCGAGRGVFRLAAVSEASGVHILCPTGVHLAKYYPPGHWTGRATVEEMTSIFVGEIEHGIDANDTNGPVQKRTAHRAGLIKVASSLNQIDAREQRVFEAAATAQRSTGAPILTHTEEGTCGLEQVQLLTRHGATPSSIVLSHLDRKPDLGYHREVLSTGVFLEYDSGFRWPGDANPTLDLLTTLAADGFLPQLMLGMDAARSRYWKSFGGTPGLTFLLDSFTRRMREAGLRDEDLDTIFVANPARAYAMRKAVA